MSIHGENTKPRFKITRSTQGQYKTKEFLTECFIEIGYN